MADAVITADILDRAPGPALSATSDMPTLEPAQEVSADATPTPAAGDASAAVAAEGGESAAATEGESAEGGEGEQVAAEPPKPRRIGPVQQRVNELTAERRVEIAKREAAEAHAARLETLLAEALKKPADPVPPPAPPVEVPRPMRETFETPEAYDEALIEWSASRVQARVEADRVAREQEQRQTNDRDAAERALQDGFKSVQDAHMARRTAALEAMPDYAEIAERDDLKISLPMGMAIMQNEDGPAVAYYLGKHPEVAERIAAMVVPGQVFPTGHQMAGQPVPDAQRQLIEMGKVFATVAAEQAPPSPAVPPPPAPISPIRRGTAPATMRTLDEIGNAGSMEEYAAQRLPQLQAERRPGFGRVN